MYDYVSLSPERQIGKHSQPTWELTHVICGGGTHTIGDCTAPISEGEVILIPPHIPHVWNFDPSKTDVHGNIVNIAVFFEPILLDNIATVFPESEPIVRKLKSLTGAVAYAGKARERIGTLLQSMRFLASEHRLSKMMEVLALAAETENVVPAGCNTRTGRAEQRLEKIRVFCACNYAREIALDEAAAHAGMNKSAFCTFMRRYTGKSFSEYVNSYRLERAAERLLHTDDRVADIAYDAGFANVTYFNRLFRLKYGHTPGAMRKSGGRKIR